MRVLVIGAGIIGSIYGWALAESGNRVVHLVRPGRAAAFRDGMPLDMFDRRKRHKRRFRGLYRLEAVETISPTDAFELIVVPVKHYALVETLEEIVPQAGTAEFLLLTQNWRGTAEIDTILPRTRYVFGDAKAGGTFAGGKLTTTLKALDLGSPEGEPSALAKKIAALFSTADIQTNLHADMLHYLWVQYAISGGLWAALIDAGNLDAIFDDRDKAAGALMAVRECLEVLKRRGVSLSRYEENGPFLTDSALLRHFYFWIMRWMFRHDEYTKRCSAHAFGAPTEVKVFYDDLTATGHDLGVAMPVMDSYADAIHRFVG
jgi:2-dehydropantoate 2-reductase